MKFSHKIMFTYKTNLIYQDPSYKTDLVILDWFWRDPIPRVMTDYTVCGKYWVVTYNMQVNKTLQHNDTSSYVLIERYSSLMFSKKYSFEMALDLLKLTCQCHFK